MGITKIFLLFALIFGINSLINPQPVSAQDFITGTVFEDINKNQIRDDGEPGTHRIEVHTTDQFGHEFREVKIIEID